VKKESSRCFKACFYGWLALSAFSHFASADLMQKMLPFLHSHNDYEQEKPLLDALNRQFESVEADIWWSKGEVKISHLGIIYSGSLEELYLKPLQERVEHLGSVYGDGRPFYLWLDFKENCAELRTGLRVLMNQYEILFKKNQSFVPVQLILTGNDTAKRDFFMDNRDWMITLDQNDFVARPPQNSAYSWYSLEWRDFFEWDGIGEISIKEKKTLNQLIEKIHNQQKKVRFFGTPETYSSWNELIRANVDILGTDHLQKLRDFIDRRPEISQRLIEKRSEWVRTWETFGNVFQGSYSALIFKN